MPIIPLKINCQRHRASLSDGLLPISALSVLLTTFWHDFRLAFRSWA